MKKLFLMVLITFLISCSKKSDNPSPSSNSSTSSTTNSTGAGTGVQSTSCGAYYCGSPQNTQSFQAGEFYENVKFNGNNQLYQFTYDYTQTTQTPDVTEKMRFFPNLFGGMTAVDLNGGNKYPVYTVTADSIEKVLSSGNRFLLSEVIYINWAGVYPKYQPKCNNAYGMYDEGYVPYSGVGTPGNQSYTYYPLNSIDIQSTSQYYFEITSIQRLYSYTYDPSLASVGGQNYYVVIGKRNLLLYAFNDSTRVDTLYTEFKTTFPLKDK